MHRRRVNKISANLIKSKITKIKFLKTSPFSDNQYSLDEKDIADLADARELFIQTKSMLQEKQRKLETNIKFVSIAINKVSNVLYKVTGNQFYKPEGGN